MTFATARRSARKSLISCSRAASSGARKIDEGCTVAMTMRRERREDHLPTLLGDPEVRRDESLGSSGSEADDHLGLQDTDPGIQPPAARGNLAPVRLFVKPSLAGPAPLEVF